MTPDWLPYAIMGGFVGLCMATVCWVLDSPDLQR